VFDVLFWPHHAGILFFGTRYNFVVSCNVVCGRTVVLMSKYKIGG